MSTATTRLAEDQAFLPAFRATLGVQAVAGLLFGLAPLLATATYASALGFSGSQVLVYRLGGAATLGYFVAPAAAVILRAGWREIRIATIATLTFTIGACAASLIELATGAGQPIVPLVAVAGAIFTLIAASWWRRDQAPAVDPGRPLSNAAKVILGLATLSAATFGLLPLLLPGPFSTLFGLGTPDGWVFRLAGAGCLGYATAGVASLLAPGYRLMRVQNLAAISFNAVAALSAWVAVATGDGAWLAPVVAAAATFFAVALLWIDRRFAS